MAVYFMDGKTFLEKYIEENPDKVLDSQFVIVSNNIRVLKGSYEKQIIVAKQLMPDSSLLLDYKEYDCKDSYIEEYRKTLSSVKNKALLATIIKYAVEEKSTIVFLCSKREGKYRYLKILAEYVEEEFGYHIYNYKKYKKGREKVTEYNPSYTLSRCDRALKKAKKAEKKLKLSKDSTRIPYFKSLSKKELIKMARKEGVYVVGMSKSELIDTLDAFMSY